MNTTQHSTQAKPMQFVELGIATILPRLKLASSNLVNHHIPADVNGTFMQEVYLYPAKANLAERINEQKELRQAIISTLQRYEKRCKDQRLPYRRITFEITNVTLPGSANSYHVVNYYYYY